MDQSAPDSTRLMAQRLAWGMLLVGLAYIALLPPYLPVERMHFARAYWLSTGGIVENSGRTMRLPSMPITDMAIFDGPGRISWLTEFNRSHHWTARKLAPQTTVNDESAIVVPALDAPAALAALAGRLFGSRTIVVFYLARIFGLVTGCILVRVAMRLWPHRLIGVLGLAASLLGLFSLVTGTALLAGTGIVLVALMLQLAHKRRTPYGSGGES